MKKTIETARLLLRPVTMDDAEDMFEWVSDPAVNRYMPYPLYHSIEQVRVYISTIPEDANEFAFCLKETGKVIGAGSVHYDPERNAYELGYNLSRKYWGSGYATEASEAMIRWAHDELGVHDFCANHANANAASANVLKKCGFVFDHYGRYSRFDGSETFDASFYTMHLE